MEVLERIISSFSIALSRESSLPKKLHCHLAVPCCGCFVTIPFRQPKRLSRYGGHSHIGVPYFCKSCKFEQQSMESRPESKNGYEKWTTKRGKWMVVDYCKITLYRQRKIYKYVSIIQSQKLTISPPLSMLFNLFCVKVLLNFKSKQHNNGVQSVVSKRCWEY